MSDGKNFLDAVEKFGDELLQEYPELKDTLESSRSGKISTEQAVKDVWRILGSHPEADDTLSKALHESFGLETSQTDLALFPERSQMLERWGFTEEDLIFQPFEDRPGYQMLHPLLMGMIVELLQYDGDVPELRSGKLPEGGSPAVPVKTVARDPVHVGDLLQRASSEVMKELQAATSEHDQKVGKMIGAIGGSGEEFSGLVRQEMERGIGVPGYRPGHRAQMRTVEPSASSHEIARLPHDKRQKLAHKTLTSTQGRRSVVPAIQDLVLQGLHQRGYTAIRNGQGEEIFAEEQWTIGIEGGANERNPNFNFVDTAAAALVAKLGRSLSGEASRYSNLHLKVSPVNDVAERRVGWVATLYA